jgi:3'(2'), 5'-bisphosphate nucleotidase
MNIEEAKKITLSLIDSFNRASQVALDLRKVGLIKKVKSDNTPVSNGDIQVNKILTKKIQEITPNIAIVSEESSNHKWKSHN